MTRYLRKHDITSESTAHRVAQLVDLDADGVEEALRFERRWLGSAAD